MKYAIFLIKTAYEDFVRNKGRTVLTSLGILIGVLSVVLLMAFGLGLKKYISDQFESLGKNLVMVMPGQGFGRDGGRSLIGGIQFDFKDINKLKRIKGIKAIAPYFMKTLKVEYKTKSELSMLLATTGESFEVTNFKIAEGRAFSNSDNEKSAKVVVMGSETAEKLFGNNEDKVGKYVRIQGQRFKVIGVMQKQGGGALGSDFNTRSIVPYKSAYFLNPTKKFFAIYLKAGDGINISNLKSEIKSTLLKRYKEDDFSVTDQVELLSTINSIFSILNLVLVAIAAISLVVGGIGIMNIMYVTVTERIKEIGIRRALGARKNDILYQFMVEAVALSLIGGLLGLVLAYLIVALIYNFFPAYIDLFSVFLALAVSSIIGFIFGVFPAKKAADLTPIEAIRYE
ncbi:MAG: ABC transporter, permease protein [Candidatus Roizmanbacteria bacterium GW2011_GWA2_36_23]|uniref:ABC transporter, permease protein n=1 Tax=Candidatus Roizmanbacteria bacterium GW2011_GWA2_36_23 TaxID=1618480 RepID=A0A0G0GQ66_9BACT|nr:MAG: ABC transporter, permease protein [Candidatus Roizmanbacteria bacterium GW2011_GWA2_36_23]